MKSVAIVLFLACACSGQLVGHLGYNSWGLNGLGYGINGMGVRTLGVNNIGLVNSALPMAYNALPMAAPAPIAMAAPVIAQAPVTINKYHAQNELGEASHGYSFPGQAAANMRDAYGNQVGSYAYINPEGKEVKVSYTADRRGFRVLSNDLPVAPVPLPVMLPAPIMDEPAVVEAKIAHMAAMDAARSGNVDVPKPVEDTPEVAAAKAEHAAAKSKAVESVEEKKSDEESESRKKRQAILPAATGLWGLNNLGWNTGFINGGLIRSSPLDWNTGLIGAAPVALRSEPVVAAAPIMTRTAVRTDIVHNPGHAMSYRVD